jgi:PAS domain S-box-containing protein
MDTRNPSAGKVGSIADAILEATRAAEIGVVVAFIDEAVPRIVYMSDAAVKICGHPREDLLGKSSLVAVAPEEVPHIQARIQQRAGGDSKPFRYETVLVRKDGKRVPVEVSSCLIDFDGRRASVAFLVDITERKAAAESANRIESSFRRLIQAAPEAIVIIQRGRFVYVNDAFVNLAGYPDAASVLAAPLDQLIDPEDIPEQRAREAKLLAGEAVGTFIYHGRRRDGSVLLIEAKAIAIEWEGVPSILGHGRDVTDRKRIEAQLVQADRLAALGTLAAGVAHEVNNPLAYLLLNLEWLERKLPEAARDPMILPQLGSMLREAREGAGRVGAIVHELRAFSRADDETRGPVDLRVVVASAVKMASHDVRHRANVITSFEDVSPVWGNEARLEQVILNLLMNAAQAMTDGGPETNEIRIEVRAGTKQDVVVSVADNGAGIAPESMRHIFDPFFTTKPVGVGTGLGLSICHSIVTSLHGQITVESQPGVGTTFRVSLPLEPSPSSSARAAQRLESAAPEATERARVLVIDDEAAIAAIMSGLLSAVHDVVTVSSGKDALEALRKEQGFDVIFCDLIMPGMTGMDLYERLREEHPGMETRMVFMTGGAFTTRAQDFLARVPNRQIEKPFTLTAIEKVVLESLRRRTGGMK